MDLINQDQLPFSVIARELQGEDLGGLGVSLIFVDAPPGRGTQLHTHPYDTVFIVQEGRGTFFAGDEQRESRPGDIVRIPADLPHRFVNSGDTNLRQLDIHLNPRFSTEWLT
jgi:mannose-6-phosphate isomerase-like protein (cupin superfamily)